MKIKLSTVLTLGGLAVGLWGLYAGMRGVGVMGAALFFVGLWLANSDN